MKKTVITLFSSLALLAACQVEPAPQAELFVTQTTESIPYRIPAIAAASNGDLIAVVDYRHSRSDIGMAPNGRIDLHARISTDEGNTWGEIFPIVEGKGAASEDFMHVGFGDPCIVADIESAKVLVVSCGGNVSFPAGTRQNHQNIACFYSDDYGKTWSEPVDVAESVYSQFDNSQVGPVRAMFIGSGKIVQSNKVKLGDYYRLYCAALVKDVAGKNINFVLYSDDFGGTWSVLGGVDKSPIPTHGDEPKVEELPDGSVLISSRAWGGRLFNIYTFADGSTRDGAWAEMAYSAKGNNGTSAVDNACNGEVMLLPVVRKEDGKKLHLMLQSVPLGPGRSNVGIYYKEFDFSQPVIPELVAKDWDGCYQATKLGSAYSTMCLQKNNTIGFLFEEETHCNTSGGGYTIVYQNYTIEQLTADKYKYRKW